MNLDLVLLVILVLCFIGGIIRGFLRQLVSLAALVIGLAGAWGIARLLIAYFPSIFMPDSVLMAVLETVIFIIVYIAVTGGGKRIIGKKGLAFSKGPADRIWGGLFALLKGAVVLLILLWLVTALEPEWGKVYPRVAIQWDRSVMVELARGHNPVASFTPVRRLRGFLEAAVNPEARRMLDGQPAYARLLDEKHYRAVKEDGRLAMALQYGDWLAVARNKNLLDLAADETFWRDLCAVKWEQALEKPPPAVGPVAGPSAAQAPRTLISTTETTPATSTIILKNGATLKGKITGEDADTIDVELSMGDGEIRMTLKKDEVEGIK